MFPRTIFLDPFIYPQTDRLSDMLNCQTVTVTEPRLHAAQWWTVCPCMALHRRLVVDFICWPPRPLPPASILPNWSSPVCSAIIAWTALFCPRILNLKNASTQSTWCSLIVASCSFYYQIVCHWALEYYYALGLSMATDCPNTYCRRGHMSRMYIPKPHMTWRCMHAGTSLC